MLSQIKVDDALTAAWWHQLQEVKVNPDGTPADIPAAVRKAYEHLVKTTPRGGIYCIATQNSHQNSPKHTWFSTPEGAAVFAVYESLVKHCTHIWYATSSYTNEPVVNKYGNPSRSAQNVVGVKALWVDLDVAKAVPEEFVNPIRMLNLCADKYERIAKLPVEQQETVKGYLKELDKYHSQQDAIEGLIDFVNKTGLAPSTVVSSGRGVHAYWVMDEAITANAWKQLAESFKHLTNHHGLRADPMRTADAASLMRLPGTWHRKGDPLEVYTIKAGTLTYKYEALDATVREKLRLVSPSAARSVASNKHAPTGVAAALIRPSEFPPANAELVATKCQQVRFFRQSRGMVDEPVWYLLAGTLGHCVNGDAYFQEWSSGHPQYDYNAAQTKLEQWRERTTGPSSCGAFESKNEAGCVGCTYKGKIAFPVQLGEEAAPLVESTPVPTPVELLPDASGDVVQKQYVPPTVLGNFHRTTKGIQVVDDALPAPITICEHDVWITRNSHDRVTDCRVANLCYRDHHGELNEYQIKASVLSDQKALLQFLYDKGLYIKPEHVKAMSSYLQAYINDLAKNQKVITLHSSMGWAHSHDPDGREKEAVGFVLGNRLITKNGVQEAGLSPRIREFSKDFHSLGKKEEWSKRTRIFKEKGLEPHTFAFLCGFGSPLMKFTSINGAMVSLLGPTGVGKTSSSLFALSMYGNPEKLKMKWGDTPNSIFQRIAQTKNLPVLIDEFTNAESDPVSQFAYDVSNGKQRARLNANSTLQNGDVEPWHLIALATTNESLLEKVKANKGDATAAIARILEYPIMIDDRWLDFVRNDLLEVFSSNYGIIGEEYLSYVVKNSDTLKTVIPQMMQWVKENSGNLGQHRFLHATVAAALVGGHIAKTLGLIEFDMDDVTQWALNLLREYGGKNSAAQVNPLDVLGTYLSENNGKILSTSKAVNGVVRPIGDIPRGTINARLDVHDEKLYIRKDALERWMTQRKYNHGDIFVQLMRSGVMGRTPEIMNITKGMDGMPSASVMCYVLDAKKLGISVEVINEPTD